MRWTKELDKELTNLINSGLRHNEVGFIMGRSKSSIFNRCYRLGLTIQYVKEIECLNCGDLFEGFIKQERKFCGSSCAGAFNNRQREHSEETKIKISEGLKNAHKTNPKPKINTLKISVPKIRLCKECEVNIVEKRRLICDDCRVEYYDYYRPACKFSFDVKDYPDEFDFELLERVGWYRPSNRGDNLNGVSRDHLYSVREGFTNKVSPKILKHPANCGLILHQENNKKNTNSCITIGELLKRIEIWDNKYGKI